jgi:hypothetical protein
MNVTGADMVQQICPAYLHKFHHYDFITQYSCGPYLKAIFERDSDCEVVSLKDSLKPFTVEHEKDGYHPLITFVGDSLANQLRVATDCMSEYYLGTPVATWYVYTTFLRNDMPCWNECLANATFRNKQEHTHHSHGICEGCPHGVARRTYQERFA